MTIWYIKTDALGTTSHSLTCMHNTADPRVNVSEYIDTVALCIQIADIITVISKTDTKIISTCTGTVV